MFLLVVCQHASGTCQSHFRLVLSLRKVPQKYDELSPNTLPFLTLQFCEKDLMPTPNLLRIRPIPSPLGHILSYLESPQSHHPSWPLLHQLLTRSNQLIKKHAIVAISGLGKHSAPLIKCINTLQCFLGSFTMYGAASSALRLRLDTWTPAQVYITLVPVLGRKANLKESLESKELATWGYKY